MSKKDLTEEDIKLRYITPSIVNKGWSVQDITMETKVKLTDGKINLRGNLVSRGKAKFADYVLYYNRTTPKTKKKPKHPNPTHTKPNHHPQLWMSYPLKKICMLDF